MGNIYHEDHRLVAQCNVRDISQRVLQRARGAGAWGCVAKDDEPNAILRAVHEVAAGRPGWPGRNAH